MKLPSENKELKSDRLSLRWEGLTLTTKDNKKLLNNLRGQVRSGEFVSIMGPSGAGKSSLLSVLTARLTSKQSKLLLEGQVTIKSDYFSICVFECGDLCLARGSVAGYSFSPMYLISQIETFLFNARLKLWSLTESQQQRRSEQLLRKLNLVECANTLVGNNQFKKSISGGQKKRVSIGVELLSDPVVMVFDEPTSGLDSYNALVITKLLVLLARKENKLIIATIHQPSTLIFQAMDRLYLLKQGQCVYDGPAASIVQYMQRLSIAVDYRMNPADFFMLQISAYKEQKGQVSHLNAYNFAKQPLPLDWDQVVKQEASEKGSELAPFGMQFGALLQRSFRNFYRLPSNKINKVVTAVMIPAILGVIYFKLGEEVPQQFEQQYLLDLIAFLFMGLYFLFAMNIFDTTLAFPSQKELVLRQVRSNLYSIQIYYLGRLFAEILGAVVPAIICALILYFMVALDPTFGHFGLFAILYLMMALEGYFFGLFFGILCKDSSAAVIYLPMVLIPIILFGGLVVNINDIPVYLRWLQYLSPLRHAFLILFQDQLSSNRLEHFSELNLAQKYGMGGSSTVSWACLIALLGAYVLCSIACLLWMKKRS